jgi:hypothetical protein
VSQETYADSVVVTHDIRMLQFAQQCYLVMHGFILGIADVDLFNSDLESVSDSRTLVYFAESALS